LAILVLPILAYNGIRTSNNHFDVRFNTEAVVIAEEIKKEIPEDKKIILFGD
jgi:phosphotransferase system IIB component